MDKPVSSNGKNSQGMGMMPFFTDFSVYRSMKLIAGTKKMKVSSLIVQVVANHYMELMKQPLNINDAQEFHKQVEEANKKQKTSGIADFIEYCCSKYIEQELRNFMPSIKRG